MMVAKILCLRRHILTRYSADLANRSASPARARQDRHDRLESGGVGSVAMHRRLHNLTRAVHRRRC